MLCKCAKPTNQYHGWKCTISDGACMFSVPNSRACAEIYGEGPEVEYKKCEDCMYFYLYIGVKRCCKRKGHLRVAEVNGVIDIVETPFIANDVIGCGGWRGR